MITEVLMPAATATMDEGLIVAWLKSPGERVEQGEPLFEIETDKAIVQVVSPASGILLRILVDESQFCPVLEPVALIGDPGDDVDAHVTELRSRRADGRIPSDLQSHG